MTTIRRSCPDDRDRMLEIWRAAVDATHDFLSSEDRQAIEEEVRVALPQMPLWLAVDEHDRAIAFMGLTSAAADRACPPVKTRHLRVGARSRR